WLVGGFEHDCVKSERIDKPVCIGRIQVSILIENPDSQCAFTSFDDELNRARIEPFLPLVNPRRERAGAEPPVVFFSNLHLNIEASAPGGGDNLAWIEMALGESLAAFDSSDANIGAQIQICGKFSLGHGNFKGPSAGHGGDSMFSGQGYLHPGHAFI